MYPVLFRIGSVEITSFGVLVALGALAGLSIFRRELRRSALPDGALDAAVAGVFGGMAGAKLLWVAEHLGDAPFADLLFSRGGMSWFGGLAGGLAAGMTLIRRRRLPLIAVLAAATPALAIGHAIGRVGCLLVGDDYGYPTDLPWAIPFPEGLPPTDVPVHPTQIYEALLLVPLAWVLLRLRRQRRAAAFVLGVYLASTGLIRFVIEFIRVHEPVVGPLAVAHVASLVATAAGMALLIAGRSPPAPRGPDDAGGRLQGRALVQGRRHASSPVAGTDCCAGLRGIRITRMLSGRSFFMYAEECCSGAGSCRQQSDGENG